MKLHSYRDVDVRGRIERVEYKTVNREGVRIDKYANVYLPAGYTEEKAYPVLYVMHGAEGNADSWLDCAQTKNMLDQVFDEGLAKPFITVFPSYYNITRKEAGKDVGFDSGWENSNVQFFQKELVNDLIPAIDSIYSTIRDRKGRAFSGFSMGGATTWYAFLTHLDQIATFLPLSGDCWAVESMGGQTRTEETAKYIYDQIKDSPYRDDFRIFSGTGTVDIAYLALRPQVFAMKKYTDVFKYSDDYAEGNLHFAEQEGADHSYAYVYQHLYDFAPYIFV